MLLNGEPVDIEIMSRMSGFLPQQDLAVESLTVQEHMEFMVSLLNLLNEITQCCRMCHYDLLNESLKYEYHESNSFYVVCHDT